MAQTVGSVTLDVVLRTRGENVIEQHVGTITVPVQVEGNVDRADIDTALGVLARPEARTRKGRRAVEKVRTR